MLVITGTQRSGTSVIAKCLIESGYDLGSTWWDEEVLGGYENEVICGFYLKYLGDDEFPFSDRNWPDVDPREFSFLPHEYDFSPRRVVKFSYLLMNPVFVTIWHKFRPMGDTFLVMNRNKAHVIQSKDRHWGQFQFDSILLRQTTAELKANFESSLHLLTGFCYTIVQLPFPECLDDLQLVNASLAVLDPKVQIKQGVWDRVVDKTKVHF